MARFVVRHVHSPEKCPTDIVAAPCFVGLGGFRQGVSHAAKLMLCKPAQRCVTGHGQSWQACRRRAFASVNESGDVAISTRLRRTKKPTQRIKIVILCHHACA